MLKSSDKFNQLFKNWFDQLNKMKAQTKEIYNKELAKLEYKCAIANRLIAQETKLEQTTSSQMQEIDSQMQELWQQEIENINQDIKESENEIIQILLPDKTESIIMEIRAGEGGEEAAIFAMELSNMYAKAAKKRNFIWKTFSINFSETGNLKEGIFEITGKNVSYLFTGESGVHCVKRIPKTEKKGRTHTSTATVAILFEPEDIEINLNEKDLKIDVFRSSGPGGQSVNTTDSAVRITHIPTGIVVSQQDEKSQHKNKEKALKILKARIYQKKMEESHLQQSAKRKLAVGKAKRNERIRTYHFLQNWVKDDRIENTCYNISAFMEGDVLQFMDQLIWNYIEE